MATTAKHIVWAATKTESKIIMQIAKRAMAMAKQHGVDVGDFLSMTMDLEAAHCNGCPLDLKRLLAFDDANFGHDVFGIRKYIDRETGELTDCFCPRSAERT